MGAKVVQGERKAKEKAEENSGHSAANSLSKHNKKPLLWPFRRILIPLHQIIINCNIMANLNRIKLVLVEKNKTGKWLADELGKSPSTVSKWCQNTVQPDLKTLNGIANLLDVDVKELLWSTK